MRHVLTGLDVLAAERFASLRGMTIGLVAHPASVDAHLHSTVELLAAAPDVRLADIFGPEHGFLGIEQDLIAVPTENTGWRDIAYHSLYGDTVESLRPSTEQLRGLDALVIDLQDIGSRYYTFQATMLYALEAASEIGLTTFVLDRPNPLGGEIVEGPSLYAGYESFVGAHPIPIRHGMTIGELARLYHAERHLRGKLHVIPCQYWRRSMTFRADGHTLGAAVAEHADCRHGVRLSRPVLLRTNLSEGRGYASLRDLRRSVIDGQRCQAHLNDAGCPA